MNDTEYSEVRLIAKVTAAVLLIPGLCFPFVAWKTWEDYSQELSPALTTISVLFTISLVCLVGLGGALAASISPRFFHPPLKVYFLLAALLFLTLGLMMAKDLLLTASGAEVLALSLFVIAIPLSLAGLHWWALLRLRSATRRRH